MLARCIEGGQVDDPDVRQALEQLNLQGDTEAIYLTLLAIWILEECFFENEDEWQLIASKAKSYLESAGVQKP